jgi:hypothetical protein
MRGRSVASEPTPGQLITDLHCWIATYVDGTEGICGGILPGIGQTPLISSRRSVAEELGRFAREAQHLSRQTPNPVVTVRLVTFTTTEGTRQ